LTFAKKFYTECARRLKYFLIKNRPRIYIIKNEKVDLVPESHSILVTGRNNFPQLFNGVRQAKICTADRRVPEPSAFEFEANQNLKILK
jgi:hypothetical protein